MCNCAAKHNSIVREDPVSLRLTGWLGGGDGTGSGSVYRSSCGVTAARPCLPCRLFGEETWGLYIPILRSPPSFGQPACFPTGCSRTCGYPVGCLHFPAAAVMGTVARASPAVDEKQASNLVSFCTSYLLKYVSLEEKKQQFVEIRVDMNVRSSLCCSRQKFLHRV